MRSLVRQAPCPTGSKIVHLEAGHHHLAAELANGDQPILYFNKVEDKTYIPVFIRESHKKFLSYFAL